MSDAVTPPAEAVEVAPTEDKIAFTSHVEQDAYPYGSAVDCWAMVSLKAPAFEPTERAAIDLVAVVDKSGSMSGEKIQLVKETMHFVVDQLKETDRLGIVSYDTNVYDDFALTVMNPEGRKRAHAAIDLLRDGSSTNLCGGLERGLVLIEQLGADKKDVSSVLLMTDGQANQGFTSQEDILRRMTPGGRGGGPFRQPRGPMPPMPPMPPQQQQQGGILGSLRRGWNRLVGSGDPSQGQNVVQEVQQVQAVQNVAPEVQEEAPVADADEAGKEEEKKKEDNDAVAAVVYTFGFGADHNATLLEAISERGGGVYYYIDENEKIPESFADCLGGLLSTVGQNVALNVAAVDGATLTKVHHRRAGEVMDSGTRCVVNLGDIQSEEGKDIVVEMRLPQLAQPREEPGVVLTAELGYFNAITNVMETATTELRVRRPGVVSEECKKPNGKIDAQRNRVVAAAAMKRATELADKDKLEEARKIIDEASAQVSGSFSKDEDLSKALLADLQQSKSQLRSRSVYHKGGSNFMYMKAQSHAVQRSSAADDSSYATPRKLMMKKAAKKK